MTPLARATLLLGRAMLLGLALATLPTLTGCSLFRNKPDIEPVQPAVPGDGPDPRNDEIRCAVSGKVIPLGDRQFRYVYQGKTYYLSNDDCLSRFKANPEKYL